MIARASIPQDNSLHGVVLGAADSPADVPHQLKLSFSSDALNFRRSPAWEHVDQGPRFSSRVALHRHPEGWVLEIDCEGKGDFLIRPDGIEVHWRAGTDPWHYLQTLGIAVYLELKGVLCLHANTLESQGQAIGLVAPSRTGKSTATAAFAVAGWRMLSDDMAAVHHSADSWYVYSSRSQTRLWPDAGEYFHGAAYRACDRVHARFEKRTVTLNATVQGDAQAPYPLRRLYLLERSTATHGPLSILPVNAAEAALVLLRNSIVGEAAGVLGIEAQRLGAVAKLASSVSLKKVIYPSGFERLDALRGVIEQDLCMSQ